MKKFREFRKSDEYGAVLNEINLLENKLHSTLEDEDILEFLYEMARDTEDKAASYLENFFEHWLKWKYIPQLRTSSWIKTLNSTTVKIISLISKNKSLKKGLLRADYYETGFPNNASLYENSYVNALMSFEDESFEAIDEAKGMIEKLEEYSREDFSYLRKPIPQKVPFPLEDILSKKALAQLGNLRENLRTNFNYR